MFKYEKGECKGCKEVKLIVNKTHKLCSRCNRKRLDEQGQTLKDKKPLKRTQLNNTSKKYEKELVKYAQVKAKKRKDQIEGGYYKCFFCNQSLEHMKDDEVDTHHALGREGKLLTDYRNIFFAHRICHNSYHDMSADQLLNKTQWYKPFLKRIMKMNKKVYQHELKRLYKANVIDLQILLDEY